MRFHRDRRVAGHVRLGGPGLAGAILLTTALWTGGAAAQDGGLGGVQLSYGAAIVSDYVSDGETQSDGHPALQGYVEASYGAFFAGIWSSTVAFEDSDDNLEVDLYAGLRHDYGDIELAFGYYRYLYDDTGDCCGEFILGAEYDVTDAFTGGLEFSRDPEEDASWTEVAAAYTLTDKWSVLGSVGTDFGSGSEAVVEEEAAQGGDGGGGGSEHSVVVQVGVAYALNDYSGLSLTYYHANNADDGFVLGLALDF